ncbi:mandelate racemase/muconate lactonizing enzyme family protein [Jiangella asiatica]|uniref:Mandelate racemase/muconate lactonizing enzyme family protein n=1 Tax=Jiangella asiatica TaxID=2530372 RepID=A0A4R5DUZ8_9ACTN|nr:mandelate racemase/muconate lactonizing enzyme family protein [Jiangella asiatica]TDE15045.1 mandelate racemase/muconate lactonizing enzyme family protein [Jiangella asiatica]
MLIRRIETFVLKLNADEAYLGALRDGATIGPEYTVREPWRSLYSSRFETLLVKVTAEDGTAGWGEALAPVAPEVPAAIVDRLLAPVLRGMDARRPRPAWSKLRDLMRERGHLVGHQADALAAVDIALWDLAGRLAGRPVAELLGGAFRDHVPVYVSGLPRTTDDERAALAADWVGRGATAVKLHLGHGVAADLATVDAVRAAAPALRVAVDAHWVYDVPDALRLADGLAERGGWFLEAPLAPEDVAGHAELVRQARLPIAVGEALRNRYEFGQWLDARALRVAQPDVARTGITEAVVVAELAAARQVPVAPHHSTGLAVALAAGLHVSAAVEHLAVFEYQPTSVDVGQRLLQHALAVHPGAFALPTGPGLGVDVDEEAVRKLADESGAV